MLKTYGSEIRYSLPSQLKCLLFFQIFTPPTQNARNAVCVSPDWCVYVSGVLVFYNDRALLQPKLLLYGCSISKRGVCMSPVGVCILFCFKIASKWVAHALQNGRLWSQSGSERAVLKLRRMKSGAQGAPERAVAEPK